MINLYNALAYLLKEDQIPTGKKGVADAQGTMTRYGFIKQFYESNGDSECELSKVLAEKFKTLLTKFDHGQSYEVNIDFHSLDKKDNTGEQEPDLYGNIIIEKSGKPLLVLKMQNGHGLLTLTKINNTRFGQSDLIQKNPTVILLSNRNFESYKKDHPYYCSFHGPKMLEPGETEVDKIFKFIEQTDKNQLIGANVKEFYTLLLFENIKISASTPIATEL